MSLPIDDLASTIDMTRRDQWGRYLVVPPDKKKPVGYTRVTTVAGTLDNGGGLAPWKSTMTVIGTLLRKGIKAKWEALLAVTEGDPWYSSQQTKGEAKKLVEEAASVGGANDRRDIGTSLHTLTALVDLGRTDLVGLSDETQDMLDAYVTGLDNAGVSIVDKAIEMTVVLDEWKVAGTLDRLVEVPGFELPLIADLKTGADLSYSWASIAVQLAAYSRGDAVYEQGAAKDGSQDVRHPMPAVDQTTGLIMHLDAGTGELALWLVDLDAGWEAFELSMRVREWRKAEVARPLDAEHPATVDDDLEAVLASSIEEVAAPAVIDVDHTPELREWLRDRVTIIGATAGAREMLAELWPADVAFLHKSDDHTIGQLDIIERTLDMVEAKHEIPFGPPRPGLAKIIRAFPGSKIEAE